MNASTDRRPQRRGFTLMEMLVVLGIIVLLLALVTPRILGTLKRADTTAAESQLKLLRQCLQRYALDMKEFPTTEQGLKALIQCPADVKESVASRWNGPYTEGGELPKDPWGNDYQYEYPPTRGSGDYPDIWSWGPDGEDGTADDVCSWTAAGGAGAEKAGPRKR
jgi:general secretion pathway protein G